MLSNWAHPNSLLLFPFFFSPLLSLSLADKRPWRSLTKQVGNTLLMRLSSAPPCCLHLLQALCTQQVKIIIFPLIVEEFLYISVKVLHVAFVHDWRSLSDSLSVYIKKNKPDNCKPFLASSRNLLGNECCTTQRLTLNKNKY